MTMRRVLPWALLLLAVAAVAWWASRPPAVPALQVQTGPLVRSLQFSARVAAQSSVDVGATLTGRVATVAVREGDDVAAGTPLLRLEDDEARAALAQAEAQLAQARAAREGAGGSRLRAAEAQLAQAEAQRVAALADRQRTADLVARGFLSPARDDEAARALAVADAQAAAARAQRDALASRGSERVQADAAVAAAEAAMAAARVRLAQTVVRAPTAARVLQRAVEPGQIVQPGRALLTLALAGPVELVAQVDERFLDELRVGQTATVVADAFPREPFGATLQRIAPRVDAQRGAVDLHLRPEVAPSFLREDMTLAVAVVTTRRDRALVMPLAALRAGDEAWVVRDGRVEARRLTLGLRSDAGVEVLEGLAEGDWVMLGDQPGPGQRARAVAATLPAAGSSGGMGAAGAAMTQAMGR
ncbi:MAG: efflux RND transporter periplasmic adaptor subunit [Burkholderiaceae bacterium]|nr:efflux RND transporter periplasmic adaptor subunit [Burkholderiaceae bacterium]